MIMHHAHTHTAVKVIEFALPKMGYQAYACLALPVISQCSDNVNLLISFAGQSIVNLLLFLL